MQKTKFLLLLLFATVSGFSQVSLVKDVNSGAGSALVGSYQQIVKFNNRLYFPADDGVHGKELWKSNGVGPGTSLVADLNPNANTGSDPSQLTAIGTRLFFVADDGVHGRELWVTDGTNPPVMLEIEPGAAGPSVIRSIIAADNVYYFLAVTSTEGGELWAYDPSKPAGIQLNVKTGVLGAAGTDPAWLAYGNDHIWGHWDELTFDSEPTHKVIYWIGGLANSPTYQLWKYQIMTDATSVVGTFDSANPNFQPPVAFDGKVYFPAYAGGAFQDFKLHYSDGTTISVYQDPNTFDEVDNPFHLTLYQFGADKGLYFLADDPTMPSLSSIGKIEGTTGSLKLPHIAAWAAQFSTMGFADDNPFRVIDNQLLVQKNTEIWRLKANGTTNSNPTLIDFFAGINESGLIRQGTRYFYSRYENDDHPQVLVADFNAAPTTVTSFDGTCHCTLRPFVLRSGKIFLAAATVAEGWELWKIDPALIPLAPQPDPADREAFVENEAATAPFTLGPNPADESCILHFETESPEGFVLTVLDNAGKNVLETILPEGAGEYTITTANLPKGLYFIQLRGEKTNLTYHERMVVSH